MIPRIPRYDPIGEPALEFVGSAGSVCEGLGEAPRPATQRDRLVARPRRLPQGERSRAWRNAAECGECLRACQPPQIAVSNIGLALKVRP
jgi:hypothetical protein